MSDQTPTKTTPLPATLSAFAAKAKKLHEPAPLSGRLMFLLDATASRGPTWDLAKSITKSMFTKTAAIGKLSMALGYFSGFNAPRFSSFSDDAPALAALMDEVQTQGGETQIGKLFARAEEIHKTLPVNAIVYIGDAFEDNYDTAALTAYRLSQSGAKLFMFHEGAHADSEHMFKKLAERCGGAFAKFDESSAAELASLLEAVAVYATGGRKALAKSGTAAATLLLSQLT